MIKKYYFISASTDNRTLNLGYVSDKDNPLNNKKITKHISETFYNVNIDKVVIVNIFEFRDEEEYINFWS